MNDISAVAIFCSDVRHEKGGTTTIVGVFPDNVNLPKIPSVFAQMHVYVRMHMRPTFHPSSLVVRMVQPDGTEFDRSDLETGFIEEAREKAIANGVPYIGMVTSFSMAPMRISQEGRLQVIVSVDGKDYVAGALNCRLAPSSAT